MGTPVTAPAAPPQSRPSRRIPMEHPTLTPAQLERIAAHGRRRKVEEGEVLVEPGERTARFYLVVSGRIDAVLRLEGTEEVGTSFEPPLAA